MTTVGGPNPPSEELPAAGAAALTYRVAAGVRSAVVRGTVEESTANSGGPSGAERSDHSMLTTPPVDQITESEKE